MGNLVQWFDRLAYPGFRNNWDDELLRQEILLVLRPEHHILDLGAGAGIVAQMNVRGRVAKVCGVDPDSRVASNPHLDEAKIGCGESIPYPDASFDVVFADNVLEHLEDPKAVLKEVHRVLNPGGVFFAKTPNRWHYMPIIAQLMPHRFHRFVKSLMGLSSDDTFPTRYRINTSAAVKRYAALTGFDVEEIKLIEGRPEYLRLWFLTYVVGFCYERIVNFRLLASFRILLILRLRKPASKVADISSYVSVAYPGSQDHWPYGVGREGGRPAEHRGGPAAAGDEGHPQCPDQAAQAVSTLRSFNP